MLIHSVSDEVIPSEMRTDIKERDGQFLIEIELPGYAKENITAQLDQGYLTIKAVRNPELDQADVKTHYIMKERAVGELKRTFYIGDEIRQEDISAALKDGILSIIIVKHENEVDGERRKWIPIK